MNTDLAILLVDDSYIDRLVASMLIRNTLGVSTVHEASGGKKAIAFLSNYKPKPGQRLLMLLDIKMPEMTGFEFLEEFEKLDPMIKGIVDIIMLSSTVDPDDKELADNHPRIVRLLSKPLSVNELKMLIEQLLA